MSDYPRCFAGTKTKLKHGSTLNAMLFSGCSKVQLTNRDIESPEFFSDVLKDAAKHFSDKEGEILPSLSIDFYELHRNESDSEKVAVSAVV